MSTKHLSLKQKKFVEAYVENGGNATQAALESYDVDNRRDAMNIGSQNLGKPYIQDAINNKVKEFKNSMLDKVKELNSINLALETAHDDLTSEDARTRIEARKFILEIAKFLSGQSNAKTEHKHLHVPSWKG